MPKTVSVSSVAELLEELSTLNKGSWRASKDSTEQLWFRGHAKAGQKLVPSAHRHGNASSYNEIALLKYFRQDAQKVLEDTISRSTFDWLILMRHHGVPSRLLDWSESPLVSFYFAAEKDDDDDGELFILRPRVFNEASKLDPDMPTFEDITIISEYGKLSSPTRNSIQAAVVAFRDNPRIHAQKGVFTISPNTGHPSPIPEKAAYLKKFTIPANSKPLIREQLKSLRISQFDLFQDLDSLSKKVQGI